VQRSWACLSMKSIPIAYRPSGRVKGIDGSMRVFCGPLIRAAEEDVQFARSGAWRGPAGLEVDPHHDPPQGRPGDLGQAGGGENAEGEKV
jgi:hypothetical protein